MTNMHTTVWASSLVTLVVGASGCFTPEASRAEMRDALLEVAIQGQGMGVESEILELTTSFTIGQGVEAALDELRAFVASQVPCSTVVVEPGRLTIDFGDLSDACVYRGRTYAGVITVELAAQGESVLVSHTYEGVTEGVVTLDGTADVTWTGATRNVVTDLTFTTEERTISVQADRTQVFSACEGVEAVCVALEGHRTWNGPEGTWDMTIEDVSIRSIDPVPEAGSYTVMTPDDKEIVMSFERQTEDTIRVTLSSGRRELVFDVTRAGEIM